MTHGFIKLNREAERLLETDPDAFLLMCQIAFRAKWKEHKLDMRATKLGEALIGDYKNCGLTRQRYRSAQRKLSDRKISAFKTTNKGTIAKLLDNSFCDLNLDISNHQNNHPDNQQITIQQPTNNQQITTKEEGKKVRRKEAILPPPPPPPKKEREVAASPLEGGAFEKVKGGSKEAYRHSGPISKEAISFQDKSAKLNLPTAADIFQKFIDKYGVALVKGEYNSMLVAHKNGNPIKFSVAAALGKRLSKYRELTESNKIIDIMEA